MRVSKLKVLHTHKYTVHIASDKTTAREFDEADYINRAFCGHPSISTIASLAV
jgi:hypothetical protein